MKLFEEYKKCSVILNEAIPEDKILEFKSWIKSNGIQRCTSNVTSTGFVTSKYVGDMIELHIMIKTWFYNEDLIKKIKCD